MRIRLRICSAALCLGFCFVSAFANTTAWAAASTRGETVDWPVMGAPASDHYSALTQIQEYPRSGHCAERLLAPDI